MFNRSKMREKAGAEVRTPYLLTFHDLFPQEQIDIRFFLEKFSKTMLLHAAMNLAGYHNHFDRDENTFIVLQRYFRGVLSDTVSTILNRIYYIQQVEGRFAHFIYPPSSLKFFEYALEHGQDFVESKDFDDHKEAINLFKAYLCFNEEIKIRAYNASRQLINYSADRIEFLTALTGSIFDNELLNHSLPLEFATQSQKAQYLFLFLKSNVKTKPILAEVLKYYECASITDLFNLTVFLLDPIDYQRDAIIDVKKYRNSDRIARYIEKFVLGELDDSVDFVSVRNTPVVRLDDGTFKIVYAKFVIDKIFRGWYFTLNMINDTLNKSIKIKNFRSFYTTEFTEGYLLNRLFENIFPKKSVQLSGQEIKAFRSQNRSQQTAEPDYYVRDHNNIFLVECKDALIKKEAKESLNYSDIEMELRTKLLETFNDGKRQSKAIHQLLDNIERIKSNVIDFDKYDKLKSTRIFPILVLTEEVFNATGLNQLINEWFFEELNKRRLSSETTINKVEPVVIITVDSLIYLRPYLITGKIKFKEILDSYIEEHLVQPTNAKLWIKKRKIPFSLFSRNYIWARYRNSLLLSTSVLVDGHEELDMT